MRLFEAILDANHRALAGDQTAGLHPKDFADSLPLVALTCIDPRLNPLMPAVLGIPEEQFIWLRTAGNIITSSTSSTVRSLALACSIKGGREIAIIGHTDCAVRKTSVVELTDRFRALGIDRSRLPDNLNEFFGLFASERQNVMRGVEFVRQSPVIGPKIPVHGLLVDIETGKLESVVNGYDALGVATADQKAVAESLAAGPVPLDKLPAFDLGEMKFPDFKIGDAAGAINAAPASLSPATRQAQSATSRIGEGQVGGKTDRTVAQRVEPMRAEAALRFNNSTLFKVIGKDQKIYGPVTGLDIEQWLADGRITAASLAQKVGYKEWKQLAHFAETQVQTNIPVPPPLSGLHLRKGS